MFENIKIYLFIFFSGEDIGHAKATPVVHVIETADVDQLMISISKMSERL